MRPEWDNRVRDHRESRVGEQYRKAKRKGRAREKSGNRAVSKVPFRAHGSKSL